MCQHLTLFNNKRYIISNSHFQLSCTPLPVLYIKLSLISAKDNGIVLLAGNLMCKKTDISRMTLTLCLWIGSTTKNFETLHVCYLVFHSIGHIQQILIFRFDFAEIEYIEKP